VKAVAAAVAAFYTFCIAVMAWEMHRAIRIDDEDGDGGEGGAA